MAAVSRILNVLVILVAAAALYVGMKLASHRQAARDRGDTYAEVLRATATALDQNSGTGVSGEMAKLSWSDFEANQSGTEAVARKVEEQAKAIIGQRDSMADSIADLGADVGLELDKDALKKKDTYAAQVAQVSERIDAINARDAAIAAQVAEVGKTVGQPVEVAAVLDLTDNNYETSLKAVSERVNTVNRLYNRHITTLEEIAKAAAPNLEFAREDLETANPAKIEQLLANLGELNRAMKENVTLKAKIERVEDDNKALTTTVETLRAELVVCNEGKTEQPELPVIDPTLPKQGQIVDVNYDLNYVVISIGSNAGLEESTTMAVARDQEFICNVVVTKVFQKFAVADIVPDVNKGTVIPGDTAIYLQQE